ncbi:MoaD/ThiS family protein [Candidatus Woesearchaeota archaeon]|nr:MoaD/ThiS family protein [Candidatus Woesearchaeota archaeon]
MKVYIEKEKKQLDLAAKTGADLLEKLKINPATVLLVKNKEIILPDEALQDSDEIQILSVISGG